MSERVERYGATTTAIYFVLVFLVAWGAVLLVVGPRAPLEGATPAQWQLLPVFGAMLTGPALAGVLMTAVAGGREGLRDLWDRQRRWRVPARWYALALLTTPVLLAVVLGGLSLFSPAFVPSLIATDDISSVLAFGIVFGLGAGFLEEIGWTGFALPGLLRRHSTFAAGLLLGAIWGVWHGLADYWGASVQFGSLWLPRIVLWVAALTAFRVLMVWVYQQADESLLVSQLMHASFTGSQAILVPTLAPGEHFVWYGGFTLALWGLVAAIAAGRSRRSRPWGGLSSKRSVRAILAMTLLGSVACGQGPSDPAAVGTDAEDALAADLSNMIPDRMEAHDVPGLNVLVFRGGDVRWIASFGWADVASGRPMTPDAVFRVESISKPVTAWGVMKLAESGLLDLDAPVETQLRGRALPPDAGSVTPRQLLSHTAGVGLGDYNARYVPDGPVPTLSESLEAEVTMNGPPGGAFSYSDTGYNLLERLVQDVTGEDFGRWMDQNVLDPLGMFEASFDWDPAFEDRVPTAYTLRRRPVAPYVYPGRGSGGLLATVEDVGRFAEAGLLPTRTPGGAFLADSSIARLHTSVVRPGGLYGFVAEGYGLGHFTETLSDGRRAVWHGGQGFGWMTHVHLVPETGDAIVLLANSQRAWPLFAHVLRAWSRSLGVEPVRMARIVWAAPLAWLIIGVCLLGAGLLVARAAVRGRAGAGAGNGTWTGLAIRSVAVLGGVGLLAAVAWASAQDYLFLFSILPATTVWLGAAVGILAVGLLVWALMPGSGSRAVGAGLVAVILSGGAQGLGAQEALIHLEGSWLPPSDVTRTLSGPATEARVTMARGSVLVPLVLQGERVLVVPRISGGRVGVAPRPLDPAEPVWVEALYDLDFEIISLLPLSERTRLSLVLAPGIASDFRGVSSDHVTFQGAALLTREAASGPTWGGGVSVTNAFGEVRLVPLLALQWRGERVHADILAPAHGEVFWAPSDRIAVGLQAMIDGNVYGLGREGTLEGGLVRYSLADVGPEIRYDIGARLRVSVSAGVSLRRRLEVEDDRGTQIENAALARGWRIGIGVSLLGP